jgi:hypothetical protein
MRETTTAYYRSEGPQVPDYLAELQHRWETYRTETAAFQAEFPGFELAEARTRGCQWVVGLRGSGSPGPVWMQKSGETYWSPNRSFKLGKELATRMWAIKFVEPTIPGMPVRCYHESRVYWPGFEAFDGSYWMAWDAPVETVEGDPAFDPSIWRRVRASEYWLSREAQEGAIADAA